MFTHKDRDVSFLNLNYENSVKQEEFPSSFSPVSDGHEPGD